MHCDADATAAAAAKATNKRLKRLNRLITTATAQSLKTYQVGVRALAKVGPLFGGTVSVNI